MGRKFGIMSSIIMDITRPQKSLILAFLVFSLLARIWFSFYHFSHVDDLLIKNSIFLKHHEFVEYLDSREARITDSLDRKVYDFVKPVIVNPVVFEIFKGAIKPAILAKNSTYAPLGYVLQSYIPYSSSFGYELTKFLVR